MSTTVKKARAWIPATVTTLLGVALAVVGGLVWEVLVDQDVDALNDPDSVLGSWVYSALAPLGSPGIVGNRPFDDSIIELLGALVPFVVVLYLFTWFGARGSARSALLGAWLGAMLGAGLGAVTAFEIFVRRGDLVGQFFGLQHARVDRLDTGLYWGAVVGLLLGLVALAVRGMTSRTEGPADADDTTSTWPPRAPEQDAAAPAEDDPAPTAPVPAQSDRPEPPPGPFAPPEKTAVRSDHTP